MWAKILLKKCNLWAAMGQLPNSLNKKINFFEFCLIVEMDLLEDPPPRILIFLLALFFIFNPLCIIYIFYLSNSNRLVK